MNRKILVITGTRAEYGRLIPVLEAIKNEKKLELQLVVTGMHLLSKFGNTINEIKKDGYKIAAQYSMFEYGNDEVGMVKALGEGINKFTDIAKELNPAIILVLGDRGEALTGAIVGAHLNIPVAHIHGGEVTGSIDDSIRHSITKFSHIHFPATNESANRLLRLGEEKDSIYTVGSPGLDSILSMPFLSAEDIEKAIGVFPDKNTILLLQHPVTSESDNANEQMHETLRAILKSNKKTIIIYPNADAGGVKMINEIEKIKKNELIYTFESLPFIVFLSLLKYVGVMVGNSSSGIMEAPSFGLPVVNIGSRQRGRERGLNVIDTDYIEEEIFKAIFTSFEDNEFKTECKKLINPYGDGKASKRIVEIISNIDLTRELISKRITY